MFQVLGTWQAKFLLLALIGGSSFLFMKVGLRAYSPVQVSSFRMLIGAATLLAMLHLSGARLPRSLRTWMHMSVCGALLAALPFLLFAGAAQKVSSALNGVGSATTPLFAVLFGLMLLPDVRPAPHKLVAVLAGFAGVVCIMQPWQSVGRPDPVGFGMSLGASVCWALGWAYYCRFLQGADVGGLSFSAALLMVGSVIMLAALLAWWLLNLDTHATPWQAREDATEGAVLVPFLAMLVLSLVGTGLGYALQFDVVREAGATVSATITYLVPVVSVGLGVAVLGERIAWPQIVGATVGIAAAAVIIGPPRKTRRSTERRDDFNVTNDDGGAFT
jgi:drug/metabolite transporter (DMT)-like permease